jgi:hypothetical protein
LHVVETIFQTKRERRDDLTSSMMPANGALLEKRTISIGFILSGLAIAVTGVSYFMYMKFTYQWLVMCVAAAFIAVGIITIEWSRAARDPEREPHGKLRRLLLISIPLAFILSSQVCGLGLRACNVTCHVSNLALIALAIVTAIRLDRGQSVGVILIPMIVVGLLPHCVCHAPINVLWHRFLGGLSPTCEMMPLAATLYAVAALRGVRPCSSTTLVAVLFGVMVFIIVGSLLFNFPWQGCVDHPGMMP